MEKSFEEEAMPVLEYLGEFKALIDACGQVSYFWNMKRFIRAEVNKAKVVASAYQHDFGYYQDQTKEWVVKARRSFKILEMYAQKFGYDVPEENDFLNGLAVSSDRRRAFKRYLYTCFKKEKAISFDEMETKFQAMLQKRLKK